MIGQRLRTPQQWGVVDSTNKLETGVRCLSTRLTLHLQSQS